MGTVRKSPVSVTLTAIFAALYAVGVVFLAPISFEPFQVRVADALLPLSMLFGWPAVLGLAMGAFVANLFGGLGPIDIIGGALANFVAAYVAWKVGRHGGTPWKLAGVVAEIVIVTAIVGSYLGYLFNQPLLITWLGVLLGSVIAIGVVGTLLLFALSTERLRGFLRSHGI